MARPLAVAIVTLTLVPGVASADPVRWLHATDGALVPTAPTELSLDREWHTVTCDSSASDAVQCVTRVTYSVYNPTEAAVDAHLYFLPREGAPAHATVDGVEEGTVPEQVEGRTESVFPLTVAPGHRVTVAFSTTVRATTDHSETSWQRPSDALTTDHWWLARPWIPVGVQLHVQRAGGGPLHGPRLGPWRGDDLTVVSLHAPPGWEPFPTDAQHGLCGQDAEGMSCLLIEGTRAAQVTFAFHPPDDPLAWRAGGPVVGLGASFSGGARLRMGYEAGLGPRILVGAMTDVSTRGDLVFGATVGIPIVGSIRPWRVRLPLALVPAVGLAVGVLPDARAGIRAQAGLVWFGVGVELGVDYWPQDDTANVSLFLRGSL